MTSGTRGGPLLRIYARLAAIIAAAVAAAASVDGFPDVTVGSLGGKHESRHAGELQSFQININTRTFHHLAELGREMLGTQHASRYTIQSMGSGHGVHSVCAELKPRDEGDKGHSSSDSSFSMSSSSPCIFYSYGISHDYSFDTAMAEDWGCRGVALDPSVKYSSRLHPKVTFHNIAARTMDATEDAQWDLVTTVPGLKKFLGHDSINVLKMDCEGCEYALAQDILLEDPDFLRQVDQLAIEIHVSRKWLKSEVHAHHLGMLYALAKEAGLRLVESVFGGCHPDHEAPGCHPVLQEAGFPCQKGMMCHNLLFARV